MTWLLDLDGVVWLADEPIPGSAAAIADLRASGERVVFLTNNSSATLAEYLAKLADHGVPTAAADLVTSAQAAASVVASGQTALVCAGPGVEEALIERGVRTVRTGPADVVVVGWHRDFDFGRLTAAFDAVHSGARLVGTNDDATYPTPEGPLPGGGSLLAAVAYAAGVAPEVAGKPFAPMAALLAERVSDAAGDGGRPAVDRRAVRGGVGVPFALVLSGVTRGQPDPDEPAPAFIAQDLATLVAQRNGTSLA